MLNDNLITRQIEEYILYKRSLGFKITIPAQELRRFAAFTRDIGHEGSLTNEIAVRWASLKESYSRYYMANRLGLLYTFAKYVIAFDSLAQLPQNGIFGNTSRRVCPYVYRDDEVALLMDEAKRLFSPDGIRAHTVSAAIGLMRSTGLRVTELTMLKITDVRLSEGYLYIESSKYKKDRLVPLHPITIEKLKTYRDYVDSILKQRSDLEYFFVSSYGHRFNYRSFDYAFSLIRAALSADSNCSITQNCRLFDLRHTFACGTIRGWLENGEDVNQKIHLLSTYMGHAKPEDTYWYLSATPELLALSSSLYEATFGMGVTE